ncbi:uncharacterized protein LOC124420799 [Lucilia cuprina]|uniref:uncharacterized protein LOC124420799 n=1 Tax=Lucilia cuprina TaxID=7375 RepID=UPI001F05380E|nr:uncharacterized protein LOC124420799 [Lucilia cuprina]
MCTTYGINGLSWRFIPAGAPHMGGLWEAGVRSFKLHFRKEAHSGKYTFEELSTVLARIEACLNSRPLSPMSDDPNDIVALTPGHFLIGSPILAPPEPSIYQSPLSLLNRYRKVKALTQHFCRRWKEEYLSGLHKRYKWKYPERDIITGDLVVIRNEQMTPTSWKMGRVVRTYPGSDNHHYGTHYGHYVSEADLLEEYGEAMEVDTAAATNQPGSTDKSDDGATSIAAVENPPVSVVPAPEVPMTSNENSTAPAVVSAREVPLTSPEQLSAPMAVPALEAETTQNPDPVSGATETSDFTS